MDGWALRRTSRFFFLTREPADFFALLFFLLCGAERKAPGDGFTASFHWHTCALAKEPDP